MSDLLNKTIDELSLSFRLKNILKGSGIENVEQLVKLTKNEFYHLKNCGKISLKEVDKFLEENGLEFSRVSSKPRSYKRTS